jgi:hypothetical protein
LSGKFVRFRGLTNIGRELPSGIRTKIDQSVGHLTLCGNREGQNRIGVLHLHTSGCHWR